MILQDRHHEAHALFSRINPEDFIACQEASLPTKVGSKTIFSSTLRLQFDYLRAYFDFLFGRASNFKIARDIAQRYVNYPIVSWRLLFFDVSQQLREFDGLPDEDLPAESEAAADKERRRDAKRKAAKTEPRLEFRVEGERLVFETVNIPSLTLKFYFVDLEVLFSR